MEVTAKEDFHIHSKPLIFVHPLSITVHFTCNPLPPQHIFTLVNYATRSQKNIQDAYENCGVEREKRMVF